MAKLDRHLPKKLEEWTAASLISPAQAAAIRNHEAAENPGVPWGIMIFAGFGAVVLGLGIILLFAYNWAQMHKFAKLAVIGGALLAAHGTAIALRRRPSLHGFADAAQLLGTMLFGAGIWLVAQIYHISAHYPNAFVVWAAGALLLAWLVPSVSHGLLAAVLLTVWSCAEVISFGNHLTIAPPLILLGTGWLAWRMRSPVLLTATALSLAISSPTAFSFTGVSAFLVLLAIAVGYGSLASLLRDHGAFPAASAILRVLALLLFFPLLFILTFYDATREMLDHHGGWHANLADEWIAVIGMPLLALLLAGLAIRRAIVRHEWQTPEFRGGLLAPVLILICFLSGWWWLPRDTSEHIDLPAVIITSVATAIYLYYTVAGLWLGCRDARFGAVAGGSLLMAAWVFARYIDLFESLLARGVMFLIMGAGLFTVAIIYHRQKKHSRQPATPGTAGNAA